MLSTKTKHKPILLHCKRAPIWRTDLNAIKSRDESADGPDVWRRKRKKSGAAF